MEELIDVIGITTIWMYLKLSQVLPIIIWKNS